MKIKWNGHSSFTITSSDGKKILTDPYEPGGYDGAIGYSAIEDEPDIVTTTHDHGDHAYTKDLKGDFEIVTGTATVKGVDFKGISTHHDTSDGSERGQNTVIVMEVDGIRIAHLGDIGHELTEGQVKEIGEVDILLLPVGGMFTIGPKEATSIIDALKPCIAIPMHFKTDKCGFPIAKVDDFLEGKDSVVKLSSTETEIIKNELPPPTQIRVLDHAC